MAQQNGSGIDGGNAISLYQPNDTADDFPVLKAFQQYIDAEQAKARKRMIMLATFFGILMAIVVSVFVSMLVGSSHRNQALNDRLIDFAMKDRDNKQLPQAELAMAVMTNQILLLQKQLEESKLQADKMVAEANDRANERTQEIKLQADKMVVEANERANERTKEIKQQADKMVAEANERAQKAETAAQAATQAAAQAQQLPSAQAEEVIRLKALLQVEKDKVAAEREKTHQAEIEAYRRKHYPELYQQPKPTRATARTRNRSQRDVLDDDAAIDYFNEEDDEVDLLLREIKAQDRSRPSEEKPLARESQKADAPVVKPSVETATSTSTEKPEPVQPTIPQPVKEIQLNIGGKTSSWSIPND